MHFCEFYFIKCPAHMGSSLLSIKRFLVAGSLSEPHLEASVFLPSGKQKPPSTQLTFASFQPHASVVDKYVEFLNLNPKVHAHKK